MKTNAKTVDEYIKSLDGERRAAIDALRSMVFEVVPDAQESMNYGMPTYAAGKKICAFASQKNYLCFYVMNIPILDKHRARFKHLSVGKSCIRFNRLDKLPLDAVRAILQESVDK